MMSLNIILASMLLFASTINFTQLKNRESQEGESFNEGSEAFRRLLAAKNAASFLSNSRASLKTNLFHRGDAKTLRKNYKKDTLRLRAFAVKNILGFFEIPSNQRCGKSAAISVKVEWLSCSKQKPVFAAYLTGFHRYIESPKESSAERVAW